MRTCRKCGKAKPLADFKKNERCRDGVTHVCLTCGSKHLATWRQDNPERRKAQAIKDVRLHRARHPDKSKARAALQDRVARGVLKRPSRCPRCGKRRQVQAHHSDYSKPLDVAWLCRQCHNEEHRKGR